MGPLSASVFQGRINRRGLPGGGPRSNRTEGGRSRSLLGGRGKDEQ